MGQGEPSIDLLMEKWNHYREVRLHLLSHLHRPESLRDPVGEWSEMLVKKLLQGSFPVKPDGFIDPVRTGYDIRLDQNGTLVQIKSLGNPDGEWVNEHHIKFADSIGAYAVVFFNNLHPQAVVIFPKEELMRICERLGKTHSKQDTELQLTHCNFKQILSEKSEFTRLGMRIWCYNNALYQWEEEVILS